MDGHAGLIVLKGMLINVKTLSAGKGKAVPLHTMRSKNTLTIVLMVTSIALLLALQVLWLRSEYQNTREGFRREVNALFRNTVMALQDTLIEKSIKPLDADSIVVRSFAKTRRKPDSDFSFTPADSLRGRITVRDRLSDVQIFISTVKNDSVNHLVRPLLSKIDTGMYNKQFVIRYNADSLRLNDIRETYSKVLQEAGLEITPVISRVMPSEHIVLDDNIVSTFPVRLPPGQGFIASFPSIEFLMWKNLAPHILFSFFLTLITLVSFVVMYRSLRTQQRLMELKNDFISNVTHELKTPVSTVSVALEALKNFHGLDNPALTKEYLEIAQSELNRLTLMTDKILKAAVFETKGIVIQKEKVDLLKVTQQIVDSMKLLFEKNKARVMLQTNGSHFIVNGEPSHLTNVIYNLLDNALKYSPGQPLINILLQEEDSRITLSIQDNGLGIPSEYSKKIFEKFFRVPTGDVHNIKGYGLGLSYVSTVMKAHDGSVHVESEPGKGSNFIISFPAAHE